MFERRLLGGGFADACFAFVDGMYIGIGLLLMDDPSDPSNLQNQTPGVDEIAAALEDALVRLRAANPALAVTLTVSPVRHLRNAGGAGIPMDG
jgi:hypothetical protein